MWCRSIKDEAWYQVEALVKLPAPIHGLQMSPEGSQLLVVLPEGRLQLMGMDAEVRELLL